MGFFERKLPDDARGWLSLGLYILMIYILTLVAFVKDIDKSQLFTALAAGIIGSGFGSVVGYYFATTKGSTDSRDIANKALDLAATTPVSVPADTTATVTVEDTKDTPA